MKRAFFVGERVVYAQGRTAWNPGILHDARITGIHYDEDHSMYYSLLTDGGQERWAYPDQVLKSEGVPA